MGCCNSSPDPSEKYKETPMGANPVGTSAPVPLSKEKIVAESALNPLPITDLYEIGDVIGRGAFAEVKLGREKASGKEIAIKFINKKQVDVQNLAILTREIDIMKKVDHPNVLKLFDIFETPEYVAMVMEYIRGGELFDQIVEHGAYSEKEAACIMKQLITGVKYLHSKDIAHRDLKPENLLCEIDESYVSHLQIKIADFGLSKMFSSDDVLQTSCGTPDYAAPEVLKMDGAYDNAVDMWSIGVIMYVLLCGYPPFYAKNQMELFEQIMNADFEFHFDDWMMVSEEAKDLIRHLLIINPQKRYTAQDCLDHAWLTGRAGTSALSFMQSLQDYTQKRKQASQT